MSRCCLRCLYKVKMEAMTVTVGVLFGRLPVRATHVRVNSCVKVCVVRERCGSVLGRWE